MPGQESLEVQLCTEQTIPWNEIAFPVVKEALELYFADRSRGEFPTHVSDIIRHPDRPVEIRRHR